MKASLEYSVQWGRRHLSSVLVVPLPSNNPKNGTCSHQPQPRAGALVCVSVSAFFRPNQTPNPDARLCVIER